MDAVCVRADLGRRGHGCSQRHKGEATHPLVTKLRSRTSNEATFLRRSSTLVWEPFEMLEDFNDLVKTCGGCSKSLQTLKTS